MRIMVQITAVICHADTKGRGGGKEEGWDKELCGERPASSPSTPQN